MSITLSFQGSQFSLPEGSTLASLAERLSLGSPSPLVEGIYNGRPYDLSRPLAAERAVNSLDFVEVNTETGMRTYVRTLLFLFLAAAGQVAPELDFEVRNTLGSALYLRTEGRLTREGIAAIQARMKQLVAEKAPFSLLRLSKEEALALCGAHCGPDTLALLDAIPAGSTLTVNCLAGRYGYFFGSLCPHAGYVPYFELLPYDQGLIINYPDVGSWDRLPPFNDRPLLQSCYEETERWAELIHCNTIGKLNKIIQAGYADQIIQVAEALHEKKLASLADTIEQRREELRLVLIAGPSSSGKTSTAQRLSIQMAVNGLLPVPISLDDYYKNRVDTPKLPDGSYDFECLEAIDLDLFNEHLLRLLRGEKVKLPKYNFRTGWREYRGKELQLWPKAVLVVEGIHGLNDRLTAAVPRQNKMKLYVSALTPMNLDQHNRINTTDVRLLRRMVRDSQFRARDAKATLGQWQEVRKGEESYIFPFQDSADVAFNTSLIYELAVLKKYALPHLQGIREEKGEAYTQAQRLLDLLNFVQPVEPEVIPNNSILREFIGGSVFKAVG